MRRAIAYGLVAVIVGGILAVMIGWTLATSEPAGYTRPDDFTAQQLSDEAAKFNAAAARIHNTITDASGGTPLDITLTDAAINGYIRSLPPDQLRQLPSAFDNPQVVFRDGEVVLMGDVYVKGRKAVASMHLAAEVTEDGDLRLEMRTTKAGRLPLPDMISNDTVAHLDRKIEDMQSRGEAAGGDDRRAQVADAKLMALMSLRGLLKGEPVTLETRRQRLKLDALEILDGRIHVVGRNVEKPAE
ncbi:MAG: YpmS family protein [Phycisphaerae bacterium]|nr:YpmS family protein [Phycisphaerae bacterium]